MANVTNQKKSGVKKKKSGNKITLLKKNSNISNDNNMDDLENIPSYQMDEMKTKNKEKILRMRHRSDKKKCILYPED